MSTGDAAKQICFDFLCGKCTMGDKCHRAHVSRAEAARRMGQGTTQPARPGQGAGSGGAGGGKGKGTRRQADGTDRVRMSSRADATLTRQLAALSTKVDSMIAAGKGGQLAPPPGDAPAQTGNKGTAWTCLGCGTPHENQRCQTCRGCKAPRSAGGTPGALGTLGGAVPRPPALGEADARPSEEGKTGSAPGPTAGMVSLPAAPDTAGAPPAAPGVSDSGRSPEAVAKARAHLEQAAASLRAVGQDAAAVEAQLLALGPADPPPPPSELSVIAADRKLSRALAALEKAKEEVVTSKASLARAAAALEEAEKAASQRTEAVETARLALQEAPARRAEAPASPAPMTDSGAAGPARVETAPNTQVDRIRQQVGSLQQLLGSACEGVGRLEPALEAEWGAYEASDVQPKVTQARWMLQKVSTSLMTELISPALRQCSAVLQPIPPTPLPAPGATVAGGALAARSRAAEPWPRASASERRAASADAPRERSSRSPRREAGGVVEGFGPVRKAKSKGTEPFATVEVADPLGGVGIAGVQAAVQKTQEAMAGGDAATMGAAAAGLMAQLEATSRTVHPVFVAAGSGGGPRQHDVV